MLSPQGAVHAAVVFRSLENRVVEVLNAGGRASRRRSWISRLPQVCCSGWGGCPNGVDSPRPLDWPHGRPRNSTIILYEVFIQSSTCVLIILMAEGGFSTSHSILQTSYYVKGICANLLIVHSTYILICPPHTTRGQRPKNRPGLAVVITNAAKSARNRVG